ncbi:hypothetical protein QBC47DRAFT_378286 [Echria macrotheca]|uniref:Nephrocystin 3-like N-terminal domain-containing protein n=1 Tax=Echria macrotheca TaxID=438768 RepID=A0AAJ0FB59_9PEZI|nr:hypothetical protein QBC47DRAFT_378286 [Echria macrotheca]
MEQEHPHRELELLLNSLQPAGERREEVLLACSWDDVLNSLSEAQETFNQKAAKSRFRKITRSKSIVGTLGSLTQLLPDELGLGVLRGGLNAVFQLVQARIESQEKILETFHNVPLLFERACGIALSHRCDQQLLGRVQDLYKVLLCELPQLIKILLRQHTGKTRVRMFRQTPSEEAHLIDECLDAIQRASRAVDVSIDVAQAQTLAETQQVVISNSQKLDSNSDKMEQMLFALRNIQNIQSFIQSKVSVLETLHKSAEDARRVQLKAIQGEVTRVVVGCQVLAEKVERRHSRAPPTTSSNNIRYSEEHLWILPSDPVPGLPGRPAPTLTNAVSVPIDKWKPKPYSEAPAAYHKMVEEPTLTEKRRDDVSCDSIIQLLAIPTSPSPFGDLERVLRRGTNLEQAALDRARWLMMSDRFASWVTVEMSSSSDIILVEGYNDHRLGKVSPLSVFCASLTTTMIRKSLFVLYHFCGEHAFPKDPIGGPSGMLRSLIAQLAASRLDLSSRLGSLAERLIDMSLPSLVEAFEHLLRGIPPGCTLYIILDNISEFESRLHGWDDEIRQVVRMLDEVSKDPGVGVNLRVLATCPMKSIVLARQIDYRDHISLRAGNLHA